MNPPYASDLIGQFTGKLADEFERGNVTEALALVNNSTETKWFQDLARVASAVCFPSSRVKFWSSSSFKAAPLQGQAILYLGKQSKEFTRVFSSFGLVCHVVH